MDEKNESLPEGTIIEPERMSDDEVVVAGGGESAERPHSGFHYKKVVFTRSADGEYHRYESGTGVPPSGMPPGFGKPPVIATWICLVVAWLFLSSAVPFTVFLGVPANLAALALALISLTRGAIGTGILVMVLGTAGSVLVYLVGLLRFLS